MGNTKNKRVETTSHLTPRLRKNWAKNQKNKKINTSTANHKQKKQQSPRQTKKKDQSAHPPTIDDAVHCPPTGSHCSTKQRKWPAAFVPAASTLMALGPQPECHPRAMPGASVGAENRGSSPTSCPACTPRPCHPLCTKT